MQLTFPYVETRFADFVAAYRRAMTAMGHDKHYIDTHSQVLQSRLATRDFKLYGDRPSHLLHAGKRISRFLIKLAIENSPGQKERRARLYEKYQAECAEIRVHQPLATFFSFEAAYALRLKVNLQEHRALFCI